MHSAFFTITARLRLANPFTAKAVPLPLGKGQKKTIPEGMVLIYNILEILFVVSFNVKCIL